MQDKTNATEILRAFNKDQYEKIKPRIEERKAQGEQLVEIGGGITTKTNLKELLNYNEKKLEELEELKKNDNFIKSMFKYELSNHEYCYTYDPTDTLEALYFDKDKEWNFIMNEREKRLFKESIREYLKRYEETC